LELLRAFALIVGVLDVVSWICLVLYALFLADNAVAQSLGIALGWVITLLYAVTGLPGLALAASGRAPRLALALEIAFPVLFMVLYGALAIAAAS
jgi:hypothetical protein